MTTPADQEQRDHILNDLDSNIVVEAAAGTGKTTSMVGRMVALLLEDKCKISTIAAVNQSAGCYEMLSRTLNNVSLEPSIHSVGAFFVNARLKRA